VAGEEVEAAEGARGVEIFLGDGLEVRVREEERVEVRDEMVAVPAVFYSLYL
jgi:hypothetical protein